MKRNSRILILGLILMASSLASYSQEPGQKEKLERYRSMKIAYFTENIELTPEEAEKFWPLYNAYDEKKNVLRKEVRRRSRQFSKENEQMSEKEIEENLDRIIEIRRMETELDEEFHHALKEFLPPAKIMKLYITEVRFREYMLQQIREDRHGPGRRGDRQNP